MSSKLFQAGDRVTLKGMFKHQYPRMYGQTFTVSSAPNEVEGAIYLDEVSLIDGWYHDSWFAPIEAIQAGDWVRYTGTKHKLEEKQYQVGAIISGHAYPEPLYVLRGPEVWVPRNEVVFAARAGALSDGPPGFPITTNHQVGDWVKAVNVDLCVGIKNGGVYKVTQVYQANGNVMLDIPGSGPYCGDRFELASEPKDRCCGGQACGTTLRQAIEDAATPGPTGGTTTVCKGCSLCATEKLHVIDPRFEKGDWVECIEDADQPGIKKGNKYRVVNVWDMEWKPYGKRPSMQIVTPDNKNTLQDSYLASRFQKCAAPKAVEKKEWLVVPERGIALSKSTGFDNKEDALGFAGRLDTPSSVYEEVFRIEPQPAPSAKVTKVE